MWKSKFNWSGMMLTFNKPARGRCAAILAAAIAMTTTVAMGFATTTLPDPCGMVPPINSGASQIARKGLQETYVFHRNGVESFVIRPGYEGKIDNFGMLIPFPTPPSLRKVHDDIFDHVKNAVDPPEVVVDLNPQMEMMLAAPAGQGRARLKLRNGEMDENEVVVLNQEAIGMYEVAVLAAGSADALKKWMEENGYRFPEGMETVANEYISESWCFVAVKTKVSAAGAVDPRPGQRDVNPGLDPGTTFEGNVQGMAFRFRTDELVVPMRLSAFNEGDSRNVVYLLTDSPKRIRNIPEEFVRRQLSGNDLVHNITQPVPLRVLGGTSDDIPAGRREQLVKERDPVQYNGIAAQLMINDITASLMQAEDELIVSAEAIEKSAVNISERLGLRGAEVDNLINDATASGLDPDSDTMKALAEMTLTIVDGDFPQNILASENLKFDNFAMAADLNNRFNYDSKRNGRGVQRNDGNLYLGALQPLPANGKTETQISATSSGAAPVVAGLVVPGSIAAVSLLMIAAFSRIGRRER